MLQHLNVQLVEAFNGVGGSVWMAITMQLATPFDNSPQHLFE
jgi:hypothetical protein